jgi:predicted PurR-regulated permease PerM
MTTRIVIQDVFFFALLISASLLMWQLLAPFFGVLALAAIIVTICYPLHERIARRTKIHNVSINAFISLVVVVIGIIIPLILIGSLLLREAVSMYALFNTSSYATFSHVLEQGESLIKQFVPEFSLDISGVVGQIANFIASHLVNIFAGTASTILYFFLTLIATFYFFRDGKIFTDYLVKLSPLRDGEDSLILTRIARAVRAVALGTVFIALVQGILSALGLWLFGFDRAILWGTIASVGALVPGVGTSIVFVPAIIYLIVIGQHFMAGGVALWALFAVGIIDNILGPYVMSRGNPLHPFIILLSVLGGIALMGPIGFILGPVIATLFTVLVELYSQYMRNN